MSRGGEHGRARKPGEVYARRERRWVLIGIIKPADTLFGFITPVGSED